MHDEQRPARDLTDDVNRRAFLETGLGVGAVAAAASLGGAQDAAAQTKRQAASAPALPKRALGKTGAEVSILNLGTWRSESLDRILRYAWANGVRYVDAAAGYGSEPTIGRWLQTMPQIRKELFLVTKDHPGTPKQLIARA